MRYVTWIFCTVALVALTGAASASLDLRLPADIVYSRTVGEEGAVLFRHSTHAAYEGLRCTGCHPAHFKLLAPVKQTSHEEMNAGRSCGSCHDGRAAFSTTAEQTCARCHAAWGNAQPAGPPDLSLSESDSSPGPVTFRHATHGERGISCAGCHPRPFIPKVGRRSAPYPGYPGIATHDTCGACHDGVAAFTIEDDATCRRCHQFEEEGS